MSQMQHNLNESVQPGIPMMNNSTLEHPKLIIAILAHNKEDVLAEQINNIRHFVPEAAIVLYNGGSDHNFGKNLSIPICPYSRPLKYNYLTRYLWDIMKWVRESGIQYEYLMNIDNDVLFIKPGFGDFVDRVMQDYDGMGWRLKSSSSQKGKQPHFRLQAMWKEWPLWKPIFRNKKLLWTFNPGQIYRRALVENMLSSVEPAKIEQKFRRTRVTALEEMFFVTLAYSRGARLRAYPHNNNFRSAVRWGKQIRSSEILSVLSQKPYYWVHPVKKTRLIELNRQLLLNRK